MTPTELSALIEKLRKYTGPWTVPAEAATAIEDLEGRLAEREQEVEDMTVVRLKFYEERDALQARVQELERELVEVLEANREVNAEAMSQCVRADTVTAERDALKARVQELERELDLQNGHYVASSKEIRHLRDDRDALRAQLAERDAEIAGLRKDAAWMIEWPADANTPARWWNPITGWMLDANLGARFCRKEDAVSFIKVGRFVGGIIATEHQWLDAARDAEIAGLRKELELRRPAPFDYPGDEAAVEESGLPHKYCTCGSGGDDPHKPHCEYWKRVLKARKIWRDRHVVAWSCSREAKGEGKCDSWCGWQRFCPASTRDDIDIALAARSKQEGST